MPTYEYRCENCDYQFDKMQGITAKSLRKCPKCGKPALKRLIGTGAGIIFKGSGFYATDYRSESYKKALRSDSGQAAKSETPAKSSEKKETPTTPTPAKTETQKDKDKSKK
jgi:putative FmdB family regulatory protein